MYSFCQIIAKRSFEICHPDKSFTFLSKSSFSNKYFFNNQIKYSSG
ncbi:MAG: hypothetical protein LBQ24_04290 [Candidatus Peribacteria bacterium]|nr:hypothetical protein [Candidatus Peribacteria bacterium]